MSTILYFSYTSVFVFLFFLMTGGFDPQSIFAINFTLFQGQLAFSRLIGSSTRFTVPSRWIESAGQCCVCGVCNSWRANQRTKLYELFFFSNHYFIPFEEFERIGDTISFHSKTCYVNITSLFVLFPVYFISRHYISEKDRQLKSEILWNLMPPLRSIPASFFVGIDWLINY